MNSATSSVSKRSEVESVGEEIANSITHGLGAALAVAATILLIIFAAVSGDPWRIVAVCIYGATLIILYLSSTLYHSLARTRAGRLFGIIDHSAIFLLIAGTYTPVMLTAMRGAWGWTIFGLIWGLAALGILFRTISIGKSAVFSTLIYLGMGWLCIIAFQPMLDMLTAEMLGWMIAGGLFYTLGVAFYAWRRLPFNHAVWHLFVLAGSISHFIGIMFFLE